MKVVILAGGYGTRLSEMTDTMPKPMVRIGDKPLLMHLMEIYSKHGFKEFELALGYKSEVIKDFFLRYNELNSDIEINLQTGERKYSNNYCLDWKVGLNETGLGTMTGGRLRRVKNRLGCSTFMVTYGDGLADINLTSLLSFHKSHGKIATVTAVRPSARFGEMTLDSEKVMTFKEKPQTQDGWINGGFFIFEPAFLDFITDDATVLEAEPLEKVAELGELMAYRHDGFWQCMDTLRDRRYLESLLSGGRAPWV